MGFRSSSVSGGGITGFFGDRAFARSLMHIALPVTLQSMLRASFSIIDQVMIGQLGSASISGIGLGGKFASIHNVVLSAVTAAGAILISQYLGQGTNMDLYRELLTIPGLEITASGGIAALDELAELQKMHCHAAILGKSIYTGAIDLAQAVRLYQD